MYATHNAFIVTGYTGIFCLVVHGYVSRRDHESPMHVHVIHQMWCGLTEVKGYESAKCVVCLIDWRLTLSA